MNIKSGLKVSFLILLLKLVNSFDKKYYYMDPRIHSLGNHGLGGKVHSMLAPVFTKLIDKVAYKGVDIRKQVIESYDKNFKNDIPKTHYSKNNFFVYISSPKQNRIEWILILCAHAIFISFKRKKT